MTNPFLIESVVRELARDIADGATFTGANSEADVLRQVMLSVFSSRLRWELACTIVDDLIALMSGQEGAWPGRSIDSIPQPLVRAVLARHRYPQRAESWFAALLQDGRRPLQNAIDIIANHRDPRDARRLLVQNIPGLGPKQSSLLLRNLGRGRHVAVLDRHVLRFMKMVGLIDGIPAIASIGRYERIENVFLTYSDYRRLPADALDLAVWVVMRVAKEGRESGPRDVGFRRARLHARSRARGGAGAKAASPVR